MLRVFPLVLTLALLAGCATPSTATPTSPAAEALAAAPSAPPAATATPEPTATRPPTATPRPTQTPTAEPTATAIPTPVPPQEYTGSGTKVLSVTLHALSLVELTHSGRRNFIVTATAADSEREQLLVNTIGSYQGTRQLLPNPYDLEIKADGPWVVRITPMGWESEVAEAFSGRGDAVRGIFSPSGSRRTYQVTHEGTSNFIVRLTCDTHRDGLVNEIGAFRGEVLVRFRTAERCFWDIQADGAWTFTPLS